MVLSFQLKQETEKVNNKLTEKFSKDFNRGKYLSSFFVKNINFNITDDTGCFLTGTPLKSMENQD